MADLIVSDNVGQWLLFAWKSHTTLYIDHKGNVINFILHKTAFTCWGCSDILTQLRRLFS